MLLTCQGAIGVKVGALTVATTLHLSNKKNKKTKKNCVGVCFWPTLTHRYPTVCVVYVRVCMHTIP